MKALFLAMFFVATAAQAQLVRQANTTLTLPPDLPSVTGYGQENALGTLTFNNPIGIVSPPGETHRLFIVERGGTVQVVTNLNTTPTKATYLNLATHLNAGETLTQDGECGFLSLAFHPQFATNGRFFVFYSIHITEQGNPRIFQRIARFTVSNPASNTLTGQTVTHTPLITQYDQANNHNGGDMAFGPDGYLYISTGDEGGSNDQYDNSRWIDRDFHSAILRIDVDNNPLNLLPNAHSQSINGIPSTSHPSAVHPGTYRVPADNPFVGATSYNGLAVSPSAVRTEFWATGMRNPWRMAFDAPTGRLFVGDVGQGAREEVNIVVRGGNYGWSWREGLIAGPRSNPPASNVFNRVDPIYDYPRSGGPFSGTSITGGMVYRGTRLTELFGAYIFNDYGSRNFGALREVNGVWTNTLIANLTGSVVEWGVDPRNGDLLFTSLSSSGTIRRFTRTGTSGTPPPVTLSATGAFSNLTTLTPHTGIVPYEINVPFWSDHAIKRRWFSIKNLTDTVGYSADGNWTLPTGMVWIKHFDMETERGNPATRRKLETRFLVKTETDVYGLSYRWRADQTDADLVAETGQDEVLNITVGGSATTQSWRYPSRSECRTCHTPVAGFALSFNTRQINIPPPPAATSQLAQLASAGYFSTPPLSPNTAPRFPAIDDATQSVEARVRAYLSVNCGSCHQPGGAALGAWDSRPTIATALAGLINGVLSNDGGDPDNRFAVPGDLAHSMVLKRIQGIGAPRMPPLATSERDLAAEALLTEWITAHLPGRQTFAQWQVSHFGSTTAPQAAPNVDHDNDGRTNAQEFLSHTSPTQPEPHPLQGVQSAGGSLELRFTHPAHRRGQIEMSADLQTGWQVWNVPQNAPFTPATTAERVIPIPSDLTQRFFRLRLTEQ